MGLSKIWDAIRSGFFIFEWQDVVDILLIAFIIYQIIILSRQTRAVQVVKGLALVLIGYLIASRLNLIGVTWLLDKVLGAGALVLIIIFQPEFRRGLEKIGRGRFFTSKKRMADDEAVRTATAVSRAMENMARRKVGALIVVEKRTGLGEQISTGTRIDGVVSANLLEQIFEPNTPLHDGAVIIQDNKILAAGCFLPLTDNNTISSQLGTRHRAALGMSEISDALVFVVSEETGSMSVAREGQLRRPIRAQDIVELMMMLSDDASNNLTVKWKSFFQRKKEDHAQDENNME